MSRTRTAGLAVLALLGLLDLAGLAGFAMDDAPPAWVLLTGGALGLITLIGAGLAFAGRPGGLATVAVTRVVSAVLGVGAFTDSTAPAWSKVVVGVATVLTIGGVAMVIAGKSTVAARPEA
jgi:hypothetical protein